ncbi:hypothetical protein Tco_0837347 [Tanacetum coccineum]
MLTRGRSRVALRSSSPTTSTSKIPTAPILPVQSAIVTPSSELLLYYCIIYNFLTPLKIVDDELFLSVPGREFPIG